MNYAQKTFIQSFKYWAAWQVANMDENKRQQIFNGKSPQDVIDYTARQIKKKIVAKDADKKLMRFCYLACQSLQMDFDLFKDEIATRKHKIVCVKKFVMKFLRDKSKMGVKDIGDLFMVDHSTVSTHIDDLNGWIENNKKIKEQYDNFEEMAVKII